jgi:hypothetical protein
MVGMEILIVLLVVAVVVPVVVVLMPLELLEKWQEEEVDME